MGIIHTGTWEWRIVLDGTAEASGDCAANPMTCTSWWYGNLGNPFSWGIGYDGYNHLSLAAKAGTLQQAAPNNVLLDGVFTDPQLLPAGFRVHDDYTFQFGTTGPGPTDGWHMNVKFTVLGIDENITDFGAAHSYARQLSSFGDDSAINLLAFLSIGGWLLQFEAGAAAYPTAASGTVLLLYSSPPKFTGVYDIIWWWWTLPSKDACGNVLGDNHLVFAGDPPTPDYEKLDPTDPDAHPTPVIESIEPDHGPVAGGDAIIIRGSGFGDGATVDVGGSAATSVNVVNSSRIECNVPSHVAGSALVVVTNPDGVHS